MGSEVDIAKLGTCDIVRFLLSSVGFHKNKLDIKNILKSIATFLKTKTEFEFTNYEVLFEIFKLKFYTLN